MLTPSDTVVFTLRKQVNGRVKTPASVSVVDVVL